MNISDIINSLSSFTSMQDGILAKIAQQADEASKDFASGKLSVAEYQEIISNINDEQLITVSTLEIVAKQKLENLLSTIASASTIIKAL